MYIAFDLQSEHISNYYELYLLRTQQEHQNENASSSTVTESYTEDNEGSTIVIMNCLILT